MKTCPRCGNWEFRLAEKLEETLVICNRCNKEIGVIKIKGEEE